MKIFATNNKILNYENNGRVYVIYEAGIEISEKCSISKTSTGIQITIVY